MLTEEVRATIEAEVERDLAFKRAGVPQCEGCKQPRPWDEHGQCRHCGRFAQGRKDTRGYSKTVEVKGSVDAGNGSRHLAVGPDEPDKARLMALKSFEIWQVPWPPKPWQVLIETPWTNPTKHGS